MSVEAAAAWLGRRELRRSLSQSALLVALFVLGMVGLLIWTYRPAVVEGESMQPGILNGEHVLINVHAFDDRLPKRGDIIVFDYPHDPSREFIKRVVGLPGETVAANRGHFVVDGNRLTEPWSLCRDLQDMAPVKVPSYSVFVAGDNRPRSSDSRLWGPLGVRFIRGRADYIVWPLSCLSVIH
ncbi:MAG: signal peptidase I [Candidatus Xenobia bacterium]